MNEKAYEALRKNGVDLLNVTQNNENKNIQAEAMTNSIIELAKDAIAANAAVITERAVKFADVGGATIEALNCLKEFDAEILRQEKAAKSVLESIRSFKLAISTELQFLDKAVKQIKAMDIGKTIEDLDRLKNLAESATIKKLFGQ